MTTRQKRLTDQDLAVLEHMHTRASPGEWFVSENDGDVCTDTGSATEDVGSLDAVADNCFVATAKNMVGSMIDELRAHRARELSPEDAALLRELRARVPAPYAVALNRVLDQALDRAHDGDASRW